MKEAAIIPALLQKWLRWISLLCATMLIACASPPPSTAPAQQNDQGWKYFAAEEDNVLTDLSSKVRQLCLQTTIKLDEDTCVRTNLVPSFDTSGIGQEKCQGKGDAWRLLECVVMGNILVTMRDALADKNFPPMTDAEWLSSADYKDKLVTALNTQVAGKCGRVAPGTAPILNDCSRTELMHAMKIPRQSAERCMPLSNGKAFTTCTGEAAALTVLREGLSRLNAVAI
ncbi:MAG TPA: hypothetical protein VM659_28315 [Dongiaceae bacterium]|nr:hypothetical protein [Dongiaceae bacterium]